MCSLEGMMLKLKLQYFGHLMQSWLIGKGSDAGRDWGQEEKETTEDEMARWHHWLNGYGFGWTPGVGAGDLACCSSWGRKESDTTERLIWSDITLKVEKTKMTFNFMLNEKLKSFGWKPGYFRHVNNRNSEFISRKMAFGTLRASWISKIEKIR